MKWRNWLVHLNKIIYQAISRGFLQQPITGAQDVISSFVAENSGELPELAN
jgi:hypothetical protein